ncbi:type ISP restriction/modification enzyme [Salibacterium aidingense]|uniref:type ISP restriction/modification enzyme n=1 Tax=Salibacterium aidingense TaxID=384933 RepID=UPI0003F51316|nr:type ISP restriction/modification enzyme [Salibacterium aidingense]
MKSEIRKYLKSISHEAKSRRSTEHTFRPAIKQLLDAFHGISAINEPKRQNIGMPDFLISDGYIPIGYIETKDISTSLDDVERTEQISRYLNGLENFILTNYIEFRWYVRGEHRKTVSLGILQPNYTIQIKTEGLSSFIEMLKNFYNQSSSTVNSSKELAERMAAMAKLIYEVIDKTFVKGSNRDKNLMRQYETLKQTVMHTLTPIEFADMYAQTIVYGLFSARLNVIEDAFTREKAGFLIPKTNPFLRELFNHLAGPSLNDSLIWIVDEVIQLLKNTDVRNILKEFDSIKEDPMIHFYETFLNFYKPEERTTRGVYYTPTAAVSFMVRSLDKILKNDFDLYEGLADTSQTITREEIISKNQTRKYYIPKVQILDPAVGTGTFLHKIIDHIYKDSFKNNQGLWSGYVRNNLLPRLYGFELLMASYTIAHMKLDLKLKQTGYNFEGSDQDNRLRVFLTNTLDKPGETNNPLFMSQFIAGEAESANKIKSNEPIMAIIGNPPYSGDSANDIEWMKQLMRGFDETTEKVVESYFKVDGQPLGERNPKWLNDDYVKFLRFAQWKIAQRGYGVVVFITPHGFLDNPTFRGMRESLMKTFDDLYVIDLHGNANKKEGISTNDQNIFDIRTGIAISLFIKRDNRRKITRVYHTEMWGSREEKYEWLNTNDIKSLFWTKLKPKKPFYYFSPQLSSYTNEYYERGVSITEAMPVHSTGIVTARDRFTIHWNTEDVMDTISTFVNLTPEEARDHFDLSRDVRDWKVHLAQEDIINTGQSDENIVPIHYRPYDIRYTYYTGKSRGFLCMPRAKTMRNMIERDDNIALVTTRLTKGESFNHLLVSRHIIDSITLSDNSSNRSYIFPLLFKNTKNSRTEVNFSPNFIKTLEQKTRLVVDKKCSNIDDEKKDNKEQSRIDPIDIFGYLISILSSTLYKERYAEELTRDYPHIQITSNPTLFLNLCKKGKDLTRVLLLEYEPSLKTNFPVEGTNVVDHNAIKFKYSDDAKGQLWLNEKQFLENVPIEAWEHMVGGYQLLSKWLKVRDGRKLEYIELKHLQHLIAMIIDSSKIIVEIDEIITKEGGFPLL